VAPDRVGVASDVAGPAGGIFFFALSDCESAEAADGKAAAALAQGMANPAAAHDVFYLF
jgi:hypothetical protein